MHRLARPLALAALLVTSAGRALSEDPPANPPKPDDPVEALRRKRIELDNRREDLPETARNAMRRLDEFRKRDLRVWSTSRAQVVADGKDAVPALMIALDETDWETRALAAACLAEIKDVTTAGALAAAYAKETFVEAARQYVIAMASIGAPESKELLLKTSADPDSGIRLAGTRGLVAYEDPELKDALMKLVYDLDLDVRYEALGGLAALRVAPVVKSLIDDAKAMVQDKDVARVASRAHQDNGDRYKQYLLGLALARADDDKAVKSLIGEILKSAKPWEHKSFLRLGVAEGVGRRSAAKGKADPRLVTGMSHKDEPVRTACSYGAGWVGSPELLPQFRTALSDAHLDVRYNAARALGSIGGEEAAKLLDRALKDTAGEVRVGALRALGKTHPEATKAIVAALRDEKYVLRVIAVRALARRTTEEGVLDALTKATKDADYGVRAQALASLAHHPDGATVLPAIAGSLDDVDFGVRTNACLGLAKIAAASLAAEGTVGERVAALYLGAKELKLLRGAEEALDAVRFPSAVPTLLDGLGHDSEETRRRANLALQRMSETGKNYDPAAPKTDRDEAAKRWRAWWETQSGKLPPRGARARAAVTGSRLVEAAKDLKWKGLDIALLLDSTLTMKDLINAAKESIEEISEELHDLLPSLRVSVYTYRDYGCDYVFYGTPLTYDTWKLPAFLQDAVAFQGGDLQEAVYVTVANVCDKLDWRPDAHKVVAYAGDAENHTATDAEFMTKIKEFFTVKNQAVLHALYTGKGRRSLDIKSRAKREDDAPVIDDVFKAYKLTAEAGRGQAILLDDDSALIKELLVLTFGEAFRPDVENLLDFER